METLKEVLRKIGKFSFTNKSEFEALVKNSLAKEQTEEVVKQKKRIPQITDRMGAADGHFGNGAAVGFAGAGDPGRGAVWRYPGG